MNRASIRIAQSACRPLKPGGSFFLSFFLVPGFSMRRFTAVASSIRIGRTYNDAIDLLNTLQTPFAVAQARARAGTLEQAASLTEMRECLGRIGHSPRDLDRLNILHVAGTKGKGTTCAFTDSILNQCRLSRGVPAKVGLHTSPHLVSVRERLKINSVPVSEEAFARCFFDVWDMLERHPSPSPSPPCSVAATAAATKTEEDRRRDPASWSAGSYAGKPVYGRFLTLMSWHLFLAEGVDVAVYETGIGGEYDATNAVERPCATAVTALGVDHVDRLGGTVAEIAWHKAGIFKPGAPAFAATAQQPPHDGAAAAAEDVLRRRAAERRVSSFEILDPDPRLAAVDVRPPAAFQHSNATLAIALAGEAMRRLDPGFWERESLGDAGAALPREFVDGIEKVVWRGRCEVKREEGVRWHLDGAHTLDSLALAGGWFATEVENRPGPRLLIFNQQARAQAHEFLAGLSHAVKSRDGRGFDQVIFCSNRTHPSTDFKRESINHTVDATEVDKLTIQRAFATEWARLDPTSTVSVVGTIHEAIEQVRKAAPPLQSPKGDSDPACEKRAPVQVLVTGSVHLVGGVLGILEKAETL
ncbi:tetrahydrofolylpolyglutamate synthase [Gaeumannomyces tritici R3-111a-1]|uniref:Folylpolyglutamate synthase n=1 Tax=Gaeumannomyces tritici (strain R3-111a-1) TaxID=644352 RepID=J3NRX1_GAET3|nr:tetrahydrofolylpolyglutamate synthase [Gaeumannomyces tritici R3-111a-1]EJT78927.1 tetrahydrofolylpolyglutamate synthase [Gaeumannomyces tritici R3-111a-1]